MGAFIVGHRKPAPWEGYYSEAVEQQIDSSYMAKNIIADTGFWIALYDPRDRHFHEANQIAESILDQNIFLPWPSLYETINTRFSKNYMLQFEIFIKRANVNLINDNEFKERALELLFEYSKIGKRTFSLVDIIIREILSDTSYKF